MASIVCLENEWFKEWIVPCSLSSHQSNQPWLIVKEKLIMNFDKSFTFFYLAKCFSKTHLWLSVIFFCNQRQRLHYHRGNHRAELPGVRGGVGEGLKVLPRIQTNSREFNHTDRGYAFRITGPVWGNPLVIGGFPSQRTNNAELWCLCDVSPKKCLTNILSAGDLRLYAAHTISLQWQQCVGYEEIFALLFNHTTIIDTSSRNPPQGKQELPLDQIDLKLTYVSGSTAAEMPVKWQSDTIMFRLRNFVRYHNKCLVNADQGDIITGTYLFIPGR